MQRNDVDYVKSIIIDRWGVDNDYAMTEINRWINNEDKSICYIGIIDNKPMATGVFDTINDVGDDETKNAWNTLLWVEPQYRGNGYGKIMTDKRFEYAKNKGFQKIYLDTENAEKYHLKLGWKKVNDEVSWRGVKLSIMEFNLL